MSSKTKSPSRRAKSLPASLSSKYVRDAKDLQKLRDHINDVLQKTSNRQTAMKVLFDKTFSQFKTLEDVILVSKLLRAYPDIEPVLAALVKQLQETNVLPTFNPPNAKLEKYFKLLRVAPISFNDLQMMPREERDFIIKHWVDVHVNRDNVNDKHETIYGNEPLLSFAVNDGDYNMAKALLKMGANPDTYIGNENYPTALFHGFRWNNQRLIKLFMRYGANPNAVVPAPGPFNMSLLDWVNRLITDPAHYFPPYEWNTNDPMERLNTIRGLLTRRDFPSSE